MAALTTAQEYQAVREAIQQMTTLDADGKRRDMVSLSVDGVSVTYAASQLQWLQAREVELANRTCNRNRRKRVSPDFSFNP
jgi:hypothetical protein